MRATRNGTGLAIAVLLTCASPASIALADVSIGLEVGPRIMVGQTATGDSTVGFGATGRIGYPISLPLMTLTPEATIGFSRLPLLVSINMYDFKAGARLSFLEGFSPVVAAHGGYGTCSSTEEVDVRECHGLSLDAGAGLDITLLPLLDLGAMVSYNVLNRSEGTLRWIAISAAATLTF